MSRTQDSAQKKDEKIFEALDASLFRSRFDWLERFVNIRLRHSSPTQFPMLFFLSISLSLSTTTRDTDQSKIYSHTRKQLTFLILTFKEGIPFVVAHFGFDQLDKNIVPPFTFFLARAFHKRRPIGRLYENRIDMTSDLFSVSYFYDVGHVDACLRYRLWLLTKRKTTKFPV